MSKNDKELESKTGINESKNNNQIVSNPCNIIDSVIEKLERIEIKDNQTLGFIENHYQDIKYFKAFNTILQKDNNTKCMIFCHYCLRCILQDGSYIENSPKNSRKSLDNILQFIDKENFDEEIILKFNKIFAYIITNQFQTMFNSFMIELCEADKVGEVLEAYLFLRKTELTFNTSVVS